MTGAVVLQSMGPAVRNTLANIVSNIIAFFPRLFWSLLVLAAGIGVAIFVAGRAEEAVEDSDYLQDSLADPVEFGVKVLLMFFAVTIALGEMRLDTSVLLVFFDGLAFGLGVGVALAIGIAFGWGSKEYVADNVEAWLGDVLEEHVVEEHLDGEGGGDDGGETGEGEDGGDE